MGSYCAVTLRRLSKSAKWHVAVEAYLLKCRCFPARRCSLIMAVRHNLNL